MTGYEKLQEIASAVQKEKGHVKRIQYAPNDEVLLDIVVMSYETWENLRARMNEHSELEITLEPQGGMVEL